MISNQELLVIVGPTASGKTELGIKLAQQHQGAVISADSRQVYAEMNVGTAKPQAAWATRPHGAKDFDLVEGVEHYLFNLTRPDQRLSLSKWQQAARQLITTLDSPLLVGGTMLYVESIVFNYDIPAVPAHHEIRAGLAKKETNDLWQQLLRQDPSAGEFINPQNRRRIIRALEVISVTNKPFSEQRRQRKASGPVKMIGLFPGWEILSRRLEKRNREMLATNLKAETEQLIAKYGRELPLLQTINYRQTLQLIEGSYTFEQALTESVRANLRYAHRQMSWWKRPLYRRDNLITWFTSPNEALKQLLT